MPKIDYDLLEEILPATNSDMGGFSWEERGLFRMNAKDQRVRVTSRAILPVERGHDQDGNPYLRLVWADWNDQEVSRWIPEQDARSPKILEALPGAPVDPTSSRQVARWMSFAPSFLRAGKDELEVRTRAGEIPTNGFLWAREKKLATRLGWIDGRFVWPGHLDDHIWIGDPPDPAGDIEATRDGVRTLIAQGEAGHLALVALGLSAASPLIRYGCHRNPILGLAQGSSQGKSTAFGFALSLWGNPSTWSMQGGSTTKGVQDLASMFPDTPVLLEDLHKTMIDRPEMVADMLYYMGNGQRRITSSREQKAKGGDRRCGTSFYASEREILGAAMGGVIYRTWELSGSPMPSARVARQIAEATVVGRGAAGPLLAAHYTEKAGKWPALLAGEFYAADGDRLDLSDVAAHDAPAIRCLAHGLVALAYVLHLPDLNPLNVCRWLVDQIGERRTNQVDSVAAAWEELVQFVVGGQWGKSVIFDGAVHVESPWMLWMGGELVAYRGASFDGTFRDGLEIATGSSVCRRLLHRYGGERVLLKAWAERGWIVRNGSYFKFQRRGIGTEGRILMRLHPVQVDRFLPQDDDTIEEATPGPFPPPNDQRGAGQGTVAPAPDPDLFSDGGASSAET